MHKLVHLSKLKRRVVIVTAAALIVMAGAAAGHVVQDHLHYQRNVAQLDEMNRQLLRRAELAIDYGVITLTDLSLTSLIRCSPEAMGKVRQAIVHRGSIKDIEVLGANGQVLCSGLGLASVESASLLHGQVRHVGSNADIALEQASDRPNGLLRVLWQANETTTLAAVLNVDTLMFDLLPPALREHASAAILLGRDTRLAAFLPREKPASQSALQHFEHASGRYPVSTRLSVSRADIAAWNRQGATGTILGTIFAGLLSGFVIKSLTRPVDPVRILHEAVENGEIVPYFQPIFSLRDGAILGCEVLARWRQPDGALVPPDRFIPLAENSGVIVPMTERLVADALTQMRPLLQSRPDFKLAFNITPWHFTREDFLARLGEIADKAGVAPNNIVIELTERQSFDRPGIASQRALQARERGFRLALDDAGTGHNGLANMQGMAMDIVKIDKTFVDMIESDHTALLIVKMLVGLAHDLGMTTVAEGVETERQRRILARFGVDEGQGYLVSPPLPGNRFLGFVHEKAARKAGESGKKPRAA